MVVDRRALAQGGRELSWWSGLALDVAVPIQKVVRDAVRDRARRRGATTSRCSTCAARTALRAKLAETEDENLQLREALVASGRLDRIAEMREEYDVPMLRADLVGSTRRPGSARC
jgi:hypothetical protein